jgi:hypothetical protein
MYRLLFPCGGFRTLRRYSLARLREHSKQRIINVLSNSAYPLHVAIRSVRNGVLSSTVLGETTLNASSAPLSLLITFPRSIKVVAGTQYAIVVNYERAPPSGPGQSQGSWLGATNNDYTRGGGYGFDGITWFDLGVDLHFQTYMKGGRR